MLPIITVNYGVEVWRIELKEGLGMIVRKNSDKYFIGACEDIIYKLPDDYLGVIYFNDVLEHLTDSYSVLANIKGKHSRKGAIISAFPNIDTIGYSRI